MKHYQDFVFNKLGSVDSIGSTHSTFVMAEVKTIMGELYKKGLLKIGAFWFKNNIVSCVFYPKYRLYCYFYSAEILIPGGLRNFSCEF
jgi:hypothetical protein